MKKKYLIAAIAIVLIVSAIGSSIAYFTSKDKKSNTFTVGDVTIDIDEPNWDPESGYIDADKLIKKDPLVINTGKNSAFIRLHVKVSDYTVIKESTGAEPDALFVGLDSTKWHPAESPVIEDDTATYSYYYYEPLDVGDKTEPVFTEVYFPETLDTRKIQDVDGEFVITVSADAIQVTDAFSTAEEAFAAFDGQP